MRTTKLTLDSILPLTCSRAGTCCHGNVVMLNPWELLRLSEEKKISPREFRALYTELGGIRLTFNGKTNKIGKQACSQYIDNFGCSVHTGRPLACRLFPIGRQIQSNEVHYIHEGDEFPCLNGCAEVLELPKLSVGEYLSGQETGPYEQAQDAYLDVMQQIADIGFELFLDSGLAASDTQTLPAWRALGTMEPELLAERIGQEWMDCLMIPELTAGNPISFGQKHHELILLKAQNKFSGLQTHLEFHEASVLMIGLALHLARGLGADAQGISELWIETAKSHGAKE